MNKRTLQEIFDAVIDAKLYPLDLEKMVKGEKFSSNFMCSALRFAEEEEVITSEERERAQKSIKSYMNKLVPNFENMPLFGSNTSVKNLWDYVGLIRATDSFNEKIWSRKTLATYKDWTNRPYAHRKLKSPQKKEI